MPWYILIISGTVVHRYVLSRDVGSDAVACSVREPPNIAFRSPDDRYSLK